MCHAGLDPASRYFFLDSGSEPGMTNCETCKGGRITKNARNKLTDYWATHEVKKSEEFAILTNLIHEEWTGCLQGESLKTLME